MKKGLIIVLLSFMMVVAVTANVLAILSGYEDSRSQYKIADYTIQFKDHLGTEGTGTIYRKYYG
jgi:archaellin